MKRTEPDFSQPFGTDFVVSIKAQNQAYCLFVQRFFKKNGKPYLEYTPDLSKAKRFSRIIAEEVCDEVREYRCAGRVERVSYDNKDRTIVPPLPKLDQQP